VATVDGKAAVRARLLARRAALSPDARAEAAARVLCHLLAAPALRGSSLIAGYVPIGSEPGGAGLPEALRAAGAAVLLPVLLPDNDLDWARYDRPADLVAAARGLREPVGERLGVGAVGQARVLVVPALGVDMRGVRLGRGGGSYDRALARVAAGTAVVALLHDGELLPEVPAEPHDRLVSAVVTPSGGWVEMPCDIPYIDGSAGRSGVG
jgi:5-formyltetrahydrofolate cyclo-ligase